MHYDMVLYPDDIDGGILNIVFAIYLAMNLYDSSSVNDGAYLVAIELTCHNFCPTDLNI